MTNSTPAQLRFAPSAGFTLRADFEGGGLSSDLGPLLLRGIDRQIGLTERLSAAVLERRHAGYVKHSLHDVLTQENVEQGATVHTDGWRGYDDLGTLGYSHVPVVLSKGSINPTLSN